METSVDLRRLKPSVVFDAESVALLGKFGDQLAAYRARKKWTEILHHHFLLESQRDYEISISGSADSGMYVLSCAFTSACGRYSFWRLINHQAPDAEHKICQASNTKAIQQDTVLLNSNDVLSAVASRAVPWLLTGLTPKSSSRTRPVSETGGISQLLRRFFKK